MEDIVEGFLVGDKLALSRAISFVERHPERAHELISILSRKTGRSLINPAVHIIGITGPPGIGKSTIISQIISRFDCGVLLCDPSSVRVQGGAILGDRIRMQGVQKNDVFIRSVGTRGELGGISLNTSDIVNIYTLFGMQNIIIETAGTGQTETEIYKVADTVVLVVSPESGDEIQFMKSGILEIADIIVLNKADRPSADKLYNEIRTAIDTAYMVSMSIIDEKRQDAWKPPVIKTVAKNGEGIDELISSIKKHKSYLDETGKLIQKRRMRVERDLLSFLYREILRIIKDTPVYKRELDRILGGESDPYTSVRNISDMIRKAFETDNSFDR